LNVAKLLISEKLIITDFRWTVNETVKKFNKENMIIFIDTNGETYMLKNRWGVTGKVRGKRM
jgi:hypothetical protein